MCAGVGLFGTFSGFLAAWFIGPHAAEQEEERKNMEEELAALRAEVAGLRKKAGQRREDAR